MAERFVIISDLHLPREPHRVMADMLRPVWGDAQHLIVNGDVAELDDPRFRDEARKQTLQLQEMCEADGVTLTLLAGNHDSCVSEKKHLYMLDDKVLITHGDSIHPAIAPWCDTAPLMREVFHATMASFPIETHDKLETRLAATQSAIEARWSRLRLDIHSAGLMRMVKRPWAFLHVLYYWQRFPSMAASFCEKYAASAQVLITGHTHYQGIWKRRGRTIINTGGFAFPAKPWRAVVDGRKLTVQRLVRQGNEYHPHNPPLLSIDL